MKLRLLETGRTAEPHDTDDEFAQQRSRAMYPLGVTSAVFFLPVGINNIMQGRIALATAILVVVLLLAVNSFAIFRGRPPPLSYLWVVPPTALGILIALFTMGIYAALWSYPITIITYFVLQRRLAVAASLLLWLVTIIALSFTGDFALAVRVGLSLLLTIVGINVVLNVIEQLQRKAREQAITDPLTGAYNRRHMDNSLSEGMERSRRSGAPATILLIDIDHFKDINDLHGHATGDAVLCALVKLVRARARLLDRVFRIGGEEFLVLLADTRLADGLIVGEALRREIVGADWPEKVPLTVSIGVSEYVNGETRDNWLNRADLSLYRAKHGGRNLVVG
jgi:diguanylate cyclase (GGDEF)-like protein